MHNQSYLLIHRTQHPTIPPHADHYQIQPEEGKAIGIDEIRRLKDWAYLKPFSKDKKIALLANFHTATQEAQNALLKLLEEPPEETYVLIHANDSENVLPTILSRCQRSQDFEMLPVDLQWITPESIVDTAQLSTLFSASSLLENNITIKESFDAAQTLSKMERHQLIQFLNETMQTLHQDMQSNPRIAHALESLLESKKLLQQNCNTQLTMENLLLSVYEKE